MTLVKIEQTTWSEGGGWVPVPDGTVGESAQLVLAFGARRDTGDGIAEKDLTRLFTPFAPFYTTKAHGLGLAVCKRVVEAHGGSITVSSTIGKGSTFTMKIPSWKNARNR
jgi:signal transduction histidine kinase